VATNPMSSSAVGALQPKRGRVVKSPTRLAYERFKHNKLAIVSVFVLAFVVFISIAAPLFTHFSPTLQSLGNTDLTPGQMGHLLGTDSQGMDYFARDLYGGRADLLMAVVCSSAIMAIGIVLGGLAGYYGGWVDSLIMRLCDFMFNFPFLLLIIVLTAIFNVANLWLLILIISVTGWPGPTRLIRGLFLNLRESEYVLAAQISGASPWRIIFKHLLPNAMGVIVVNATFLLAGIIFTEAALAIIGFGITPPAASWGAVLNGAQDYFTLSTELYAWIPPALLVTVTILCINFIGDGLRDAFDPSFEN